MAKTKSSFALVAAGVGGAAVAGYGLSMGRDLWKSTKNNQATIIAVLALLGAIALPTIGARNLVRGYDRGVVGTLFVTIVGNLLLVVVGMALAVLLFGFVTHDETRPSEGLAAAIFLGGCSTAAFSLIGLIWGAIQRPSRLRTFAIAKANERFLSENGFKETGGEDITHYDPSGQALRFLEAHADRLVFMVVGRRGKRAYIDLDQDGRMVSYNGVI